MLPVHHASNELIVCYVWLCQLLYERLSCQVGNRSSSPSSSSEVETIISSARGAISHTREILQSTNRATRRALSQLGDATWWRQTLANLRPAQRTATQPDDRHNMDLHQLACHPFYESFNADCYVNKVLML